MAELPARIRSWAKCGKCKNLAKWRRHVIIGEGDLKAQVMFIGEAPGKTEDLLGEPFVGRSGQLLRQGIKDAAALAKVDVPTHYITNVLACRPTDEWMGANRPPNQDEIGRCRPRVAQLIAHIRPDKVVFLGDVSERECRKLCPDGVKLRHPAFVIRKGGIGSVDYRIFVRGLVDVFVSLGG